MITNNMSQLGYLGVQADEAASIDIHPSFYLAGAGVGLLVGVVGGLLAGGPDRRVKGAGMGALAGVGTGLGTVFLLDQADPKINYRIVILRPYLYRFLPVLDRLVNTTGILQHHAKVIVRHVIVLRDINSTAV